jgi:hypothetical protein
MTNTRGADAGSEFVGMGAQSVSRRATRRLSGCPAALRFSFGPDVLALSQEGSPWDCGFGDRVYADGTYRRTSRETPRFTTGLTR